MIDMLNYDFEDLCKEKSLVLIMTSTYENGEPPESGKFFYGGVKDSIEDFRVDRTTLRNLNYSICGFGNSSYEDYYNTVARNMNRCLKEIGAREVCNMVLCDENSSKMDG